MKNCNLHIKNEIWDDVINIATERTTHIVRNENLVVYPANTDGRVKNLKGAYELAKRRAGLINKKYQKYQSDRFSKVATINNGFVHGVGIDINISPDIVNAVEVENDRVAELEYMAQMQKEEDIRSGNYEFDEMADTTATPATGDAYNLGLYAENKRKLRDYAEHRIKVLSEMAGKDKETRAQIALLNSIKTRVNSDLIKLDNEEAVIDNFFEYFNEDLAVIEEVLNKNPTLENLMMVQQFMDNAQAVSEGTKLKGGIANEATWNAETAAIKDKYNKYVSKLKHLNTKFENISNDYSAEMLRIANENDESLTEEQDNEVDLLKKSMEMADPGFFEQYFLPLDGDGKNASPIQMLVRTLFDNSTAKKEVAQVQEELLGKKKAIESELKKLGKTVKKGGIRGLNFLGTFFSSADYSVFKRVSSTGDSRLVDKYSEAWGAIKTRVNGKIDEAYRQTKNINLSKEEKEEFGVGDAKWKKITSNRLEAFQELKESGVNFIDLKSVPEFMGDVDYIQSLQNLGRLLKDFPPSSEPVVNVTKAEADAYREQIIQSLIGKSGNRAIAEREYQKIIDQQLNQFYDFEAEFQQFYTDTLNKNDATDFNQLNDDAKNKIMQEYYLNSPQVFMNRYNQNGNSYVDKPFFVDGEIKYNREPSSLKNTSYLPSREADFDSEFETQIESNPVLYNAWELFSDSLKFINQNRKYTPGTNNAQDDAITSDIKMFQRHGLYTSSYRGYIKKQFAKRFTAGFLTDPKTDDGQVQLSSGIKSIDEVISGMARNILGPISKTQPKSTSRKERHENMGYSESTLPSDVKKILNSHDIDTSSMDGSVTLRRFVQDQLREKAYENQNTDMVDSMITQLDMVQDFKSKKEVEMKLKFLNNLIRKIRSEGNKENKGVQMNLIKDFIDKHLYGKESRKSIGKEFGRFYSAEEKVYKKMAEKAIAQYQEIADTTSSADRRDDALAEVDKMKKRLKNSGKTVTMGAIGEVLFIKNIIRVGLGWNLKSQLMNIGIGNLAGRQNDGVLWTEGNFNKAMSYTRKWKAVGRNIGLLGKKARENAKLTNSLIGTLGIFQNSANEISKMLDSNKKLKDKKEYLLNPLHLIGEVEKTIQRPQILAALGDVKIKDVDGNEVPVFDVNNHSNPHPAFMLEDGLLRLKPEFRTPSNQATWISRSTEAGDSVLQEGDNSYAGLFGESGKIPRIIAKINGDYRSTSSIAAKKGIIGAMFIIYKTWVPAYIQRRIGHDGIINNLVDSGHSSKVMTSIMASAATFMAITGGATVVLPVIGVAAWGAYVGVKTFKRSAMDDVSYIQSLINTIKKTSLTNNFALDMVRMPLAGVMKAGQGLSDMVTPGGKRIIPNSLIDKMADLKQGENESNEEFAMNQARMQFMLAELATTLQMLSLKLLAMMAFFPDDEEDKEYKKKGLVDKIVDHPATTAYYLTENLTARLSTDINLFLDPLSFAEMATIGMVDDVAQLTKAVAQAATGDPNYKSGVNEGRNRVVVKGSGMFIPRSLTNLDFGFGSSMEKDMTPNGFLDKMFKSDAKKLISAWEDARKDFKEAETEYVRELYPNWTEEEIKAEVKDRVDDEHPSIKDAFDEQGNINIGQDYIVDKYK